MLIEKEKKRFRFPRGSGFYAAIALAVIAAGVGVWGAVSNSLNPTSFAAPSDVGLNNTPTINWGDYLTRPPVTEAPTAAQANNPVTGVADTRSQVNAGATTAAPSARKDTMPYTGSFALPFGARISKDYSAGEMVKSKTMGDWRVHNGVDFEGQAEEEVVAIQDGTVQSLYTDPLWGIVLTIDHGNGVVAKYCGLSENSTPKEGQEIKKGQSIGVIAQVPCESLEGVHLHLEITVNGKMADPLAVMNKTGDNG
ncbi:MAG: M23 family metallopeptidase [Oscillospiraceae bacterium]|jgi:murein DD-endopeptidase MepM/ murein hydrolase activator NlpD|nr:M23 family metallopeptidase [Oscillospiraceae bacterium]